jgi:hypothetical protein
VFGAALAAVALWGFRDARASISVAISFDALLRGSSAAVVATATEQHSLWEGGRIYTYSRVHVDTAVAGELHADDEAWVRTMGGVVGDVGQIVDGEASLTTGRPSLLFLRPSVGAYVVTARAQGQFGLYTDENLEVRARKSSGVGALLPPQGASGPPAVLASDVIHGRPVASSAKDIAAAWRRAHEG